MKRFTRKKIWKSALYVVLSFLLALVSLATFIASDFIVSVAGEDKVGIAFGISILMIGLTIGYGVFSPYSKPFVHRFRNRVRVYFAGLAVLAVSTAYLSHQPREKLGVEDFQSRYGNCHHILGALVKSDIGQKAANSLVALMSERLQYAYYSTEEVCRSIQLKDALSERVNDTFCETCMRHVVAEVSSKAPFTSIGTALLFAVDVEKEMKEAQIIVTMGESPLVKLETGVRVLDQLLLGLEMQERRATPEKLIESIERSDLTDVPAELVMDLYQRDLQEFDESSFSMVMGTIFDSDFPVESSSGMLIAIDRMVAYRHQLNKINQSTSMLSSLEKSLLRYEPKASDEERARLAELETRLRSIREDLNRIRIRLSEGSIARLRSSVFRLRSS